MKKCWRGASSIGESAAREALGRELDEVLQGQPVHFVVVDEEAGELCGGSHGGGRKPICRMAKG